jgi:Protein of unknown function (DUF2934)
MGKPSEIEIVRRAYELWQQAGEPEGRDQEFYSRPSKSYAMRINPLRCALSTICKLSRAYWYA